MSSIRDNKKPKKQGVHERTKKLPTSDAPTLQARSPKFKVKQKMSREKMQQSSEQRSFNVIDANEEEDVNRVSMYSPDPSPINSPNVSSIPTTHFVPVTVFLELESVSQFLTAVTINKNMVITGVKRELMACFMPGDHVSGINEISIWNRTQLDKELGNYQKQDSQKVKISVLVIRVWNISCLSKNQLERLSPSLDDRLHYFSVRIYCNNRAAGLCLRSEKKRLLTNNVRAKTAISFGLLVGDQLLGINDELLVGNRTKDLYTQAKTLMRKARKLEFIEMIACRPILVRSSPAPSVDGELAMKAAAKTVTSTNPEAKQEKKVLENLSSLPLEADALEISLRELTLLQQWIKTDSPLPTCEKGNSLLRNVQYPGDQTSCTNERSEYSGRFSSTTPDTPRKRGILFRKRNQKTISITEQPETSKVTSDISEETELNKCDPRSGIVSYIKNVFNS
ncbi:hypothetical protein L5515_001561 [Caenorhabditis briggsae]|uniref:PDZ domain-containing protein n=1 Tax=Caenorhabditis briggsae TaxID=6238 RepID=A0AAE9E3Z5_CAEBR|nr:hypothetical protein L5515_001561 [Caenorhabditis briggsae]